MVRSLYTSADMEKHISITYDPEFQSVRGQFGVVFSCKSNSRIAKVHLSVCPSVCLIQSTDFKVSGVILVHFFKDNPMVRLLYTSADMEKHISINSDSVDGY